MCTSEGQRWCYFSCGRCIAFRCFAMLRLPPDLWGAIADFVPSNRLSQVCRELGEVLEGQYVNVTWKSRKAFKAEQMELAAWKMRSLQLKVLGPWDPTSAVAALRCAPHLRSLVVEYSRPQSKISDNGARTLAGLQEMPSLQTLSLDLSGNAVGAAGAQALAALKNAPSLRKLTLNLSMCCIAWVLWDCRPQRHPQPQPQVQA